MNVVFLLKFDKDLSKINLKSTLEAIKNVIVNVEQSTDILEVANIKKLKGYKNAYRIRIGDYRIGVFYENNIVEFARIVHRKDIYKLFP